MSSISIAVAAQTTTSVQRWVRMLEAPDMGEGEAICAACRGFARRAWGEPLNRSRSVPDHVELAHSLADVPAPPPTGARDEPDAGAQLHRRAVLADDGGLAGQHVHLLREAGVLTREHARGDLPDSGLDRA